MAEAIGESSELFSSLSELSEFQKLLHTPTGDINNPDDPENNLHSIFYDTAKKATWYYKAEIEIDKNSNNKDKAVKYEIKAFPFHALAYMFLTQRIPAIKAAKGFKIRWIPNPFINMITKIELFFNTNTLLQTLDNITLHSLLKAIMVKFSSSSSNLGNSPKLQTWSEILPSAKLEFIIPFFFSQKYTRFFPFYFCGQNDLITVTAQYQLSLAKLIQVYSEESKGIVPMTKDNVTVSTDEYYLPSPDLRAACTYQTPLEISNRLCEGDIRKTIAIDNYYSMDQQAVCKLGDEVIIKLANFPYPIHTIYWMVENMSSSSYPGNFTTHATDESLGESPIKHVTLEHASGNKIFKEIEFNRSHMAMHFPKSLTENVGFGCWSMGAMADDINHKPGIVLTNGVFKLQFKTKKEANPLAPFGGEECDDEFRVKLRFTYTRIGKFVSIVESEEKREVQKASFKFYTPEGKMIA